MFLHQQHEEEEGSYHGNLFNINESDGSEIEAVSRCRDVSGGSGVEIQMDDTCTPIGKGFFKLMTTSCPCFLNVTVMTIDALGQQIFC